MEERANNLRSMQICRLCLDEKGPFSNIYQENTNDGNRRIPLPLQIMACCAIEAYENDGMPQVICATCKNQTTKAYLFKGAAKKSDDVFKVYLSTGNLIKPLQQKKQTISLDLPVTTVKESKQSIHAETTNHISTAIDDSVASEDVYMDTIDFSNDTSQDASSDFQDVYIHNDTGDTTIKIKSMGKVSHVATNVFPCTRCERSFPLKQLLDLHIKNHDRERSFSCELCERKFFTKYDLAKHIQTHSCEKSFKCVVCNKAFARESLLHRHERVHVDVPKYLCQECDKTFITRDDLDAHNEKHKKKRPFCCRICNKKFVFKQGLERHEASHADEKPHKCNYCEASFTSPIKLMRHITTHAGLRPYPCKLCGRTFLLSHHLTRHMRTHYANKSLAVEPVGQHKCDVCSMSFRRKDSLINHSAIHSMVNLKCVICNTEFCSAKEVKEHITTHLAGLPYPCDKCDYSFETQDQLEEHELKHAEMEYEEQIEQEVTQEAINQRHRDSEDMDDDDDDIAEFTLTTDAHNNPQVVLRKKIGQNQYVEFLKEELCSDTDNEITYDDGTAQEEEEPLEPIKPIIRTEGTKVYARKSINRKLPEVHEKIVDKSPIGEQIQLNELEITQEFVKELPNEQYVDMKIGDVIYKVKKVTMKKNEFEAVAKQGNVEIKDGILLKKTIQGPKETPKSSRTTIEANLAEPTSTPKHLVTKTYVRRSSALKPNRSEVSSVDDDTTTEHSI